MQKKIFLLSSFLISGTSTLNAITIDKKINHTISNTLNTKNSKIFHNKFFYIWHARKLAPLSEAKWPFYVYPKKKTYAENLRLHTKSFWNRVEKNSDWKRYLSIKKPAISIKRLMLRNFPTDKPIFYDRKKPGEGFPFSYNDNSAVHPNEPLMVSHFSLDRRFAYVLTSYASGWVNIENIVYVNKKLISKIYKSKKIVLTTDNVSILGKSGFSLFLSKIGMVLPILEERTDYYKVLYVGKSDTLIPSIKTVNIPKKISVKMDYNMNLDFVKKMSKKLLGNAYGWGGSNHNRDCSSTLKDLFATTGKWLPRNSRAISLAKGNGKRISLAKKNRIQKEAFIIDNGIPYQSVLYMKGHIMLYIGHEKGMVKIFHDMWGIGYIHKGKYVKKIVGKTVESNLYLGKELRKKKFLIDSLSYMTIF
jgi:hypothetical protein